MDLLIRDTVTLLDDLLMLRDYKYGHDESMYTINVVFEYLKLLLNNTTFE